MADEHQGNPTEQIARALADYENMPVGERPQPAEFAAGYPDIANALKRELEIHTLLEAASAATNAIGVGDMLDSYRLVDELGRGGMGVVFRARDEDLDRDVAIKVVAIDPLRAERAERFLREAKAMARIRHPHVVEIHAFGRTEQLIYLVMELLDTSLAGKTGEPEQVLRWIGEAADGVAYCHQRGIVHRDLKPANLLLDADGVVKVADFGIARVEDLPDLTRTGHAWGTRGYAAPESLSGEKNVDARVDVYGLGACMYALLTGKQPPEDDANTRWPRTTPRRLRNVVATAMAQDADDRYSDVASFRAALRALEVPASKRRWWLRVGAVAVPIALASGITWLRTRDTPGHETNAAVPAVTVAPEPPDAPKLAGGYLITRYHRWFSERPAPPPEARGPGAKPIIVIRLWDKKLTEVAKARELSRAQAVQFDQGGATFTAALEQTPGVLILRVRQGQQPRAEVRLPTTLLGGESGWGIFHELTDEDGDGRKDITLLRVTNELAMIRVVKLEPQAWGDGWRMTATATNQYRTPVMFNDGVLGVVRTIWAPGQSPRADLLGLDVRTGKSTAASWPLRDVVPAGPRPLKRGTHRAVRVSDELHWITPSSPSDADSLLAAWSAHVGHRNTRLVGIGRGGATVRTLPLAHYPAPVLTWLRRHTTLASSALHTRADQLCYVADSSLVCHGQGKLTRKVRLGKEVSVVPAPTQLRDGRIAIVSQDGRLFTVGDDDKVVVTRIPGAVPVGSVVELPDCLVVTAKFGVWCVRDNAPPRKLASPPNRSAFSSAPAVIVASKARLLLFPSGGTRGAGLTLIDSNTGAQLWAYKLAARPAGRPLVHVENGLARVVVCDRVGAVYSVQISLPANLRPESVR